VRIIRKKQIVLLILLALLFSQGDVASETICKSALTTRDMIDCYKQELEKATQQVGALEERIASRLSDEEKAVFKSAIAAWGSYLDANCRSEAVLYKGGTMESVVFLGCKLQLTKERINQLSKTYDVRLR